MGKVSLLALVSITLLLSNSSCRPLIAGNDFHHNGRSQSHQLFNLTSVKSHLHHFGYLDNNDFSDEFNSDLEVGIKKYQEFFKLNVTGVLDAATVQNMMLPRCGIPDIDKGFTARKSARMLYSVGGQPWPPSMRSLTYNIATENQKFSAAELSNVFGNAFKTWKVFALFNFTETSDPQADITIRFYAKDHGDGAPFDGPGGILAHSTYPQDGTSHYDAEEDWVIDPDKLTATPISTDLQSVALHEIGHLLGLSHSTDENAVMFPTTPAQKTKRLLNSDDIEAIGILYSSPRAMS